MRWRGIPLWRGPTLGPRGAGAATAGSCGKAGAGSLGLAATIGADRMCEGEIAAGNAGAVDSRRRSRSLKVGNVRRRAAGWRFWAGINEDINVSWVGAIAATTMSSRRSPDSDVQSTRSVAAH